MLYPRLPEGAGDAATDRTDQRLSKHSQEAPIARTVHLPLKVLLYQEAGIKERPRFKVMSPQRGLLTGHGPVGDVEFVAVQHGLATKLL